MEKDSQTVRIKSMQTLAQQRGKLTLVTLEQGTRSGEWRERKREVYDMAIRPPFSPTMPNAGPFC